MRVILALVLCFIHTYAEPHPYHEQKQQMRVAVTLSGTLPRFHRHSHPSSCRWRDGGPLQSLTTQLLLPAVRAGYAVSVYGHTWATSGTESDSCAVFSEKNFSDALLAATNGSEFANAAGSVTIAKLKLDKPSINLPSTHVLKNQRSTPSTVFGLASLERAVALAVEDLDPNGTIDAMVVVIRWDVVLYSVFDVEALNKGLLYRANWCRASGPRAFSKRENGRECYELLTFTEGSGEICDFTSVPDFYFAGNTTVMRQVFMGLSNRVWETSPPAVQNTGCWAAHGILGKAFALAEHSNILLGRYLYHHMDFDFDREKAKNGHRFHDASRLAFVRNGGSIWLEGDSDGLFNPPYRFDLPRGSSVCSNELHLCTWRNTTPTDYLSFHGGIKVLRRS